jgi:hypothetical protein
MATLDVTSYHGVAHVDLLPLYHGTSGIALVDLLMWYYVTSGLALSTYYCGVILRKTYVWRNIILQEQVDKGYVWRNMILQ